MPSRTVTIVDYGMGNIWSVQSALRYLGAAPVTTSKPEEVVDAEALVLPGVGSFRRAMESLRAKGLDQAILQAVKSRSCPLLGICLGMQLLGSWGTEDGKTPGLGLVDLRVERFTPGELAGLKVPHIGFSPVEPASGSLLFRNLTEAPDFYFVHSYRMLSSGDSILVSKCRHGVDFVAAIEAGNIFGVQFHPEKSQTNGLHLLRNFLEV